MCPESPNSNHNLALPAPVLLKNRVPEKFVTLDKAANTLGIHLWALRRAVKRGDITSYTPFGKRRLVRISEVVAAIETSRQGETE